MPALAAIVVAAALFAFFRFTPLGKAIRACADNYTGALVVGLDVKRLYALTFGLGAACVGAAGAMHGADRRRDAAARAGLHAARLRHRHHRRARLDAGRAARRRADRADRGDGRPAVHAVGQEHVRLRASSCWCCCSGRRASWARGWHDRAPARRRAAPRARSARVLLLAVLVAAPLFANDYLLTVLILILYFAYTGQAWNIMMGFAGQLSLGHALYVGLGAYTAAALYVHFGIGPWIGHAGRDPDRGRRAAPSSAFWRSASASRGVYFAILTIAFCRVRAHRLRPLRLGRRLGRLVPAGRAIHPQRSLATCAASRRCSTT